VLSFAFTSDSAINEVVPKAKIAATASVVNFVILNPCVCVLISVV
jgi:hypothetical protein